MLCSSLFSLLALVACNLHIASAGPNDPAKSCKARHKSSSAIAAIQTTDSDTISVGPTSTTVAQSIPEPSSTALSESISLVAQAISSATQQAGTTARTTIQQAPSSTSAFSTASSASSVSPGTIMAGSDTANQLVKLHTDFRAQYGAGPVTWNDTLADYAQKAADKCIYAHTGGPTGENIAAAVSSGIDNAAVVDSGFQGWASESAFYDWSKPGDLGTAPRESGHFTQIVWKETTLIGCGVGSCKDGTVFQDYGRNSSLLFCEYQKAGNVYLTSKDMVVDANIFFKENVLPKGTKVT